jgi:hypothetical protein
MKAFIIGLFSLALLASGTASAHDMPAPREGPPVPPAACGKNGKFVIVVTANEILVPKPCPGTKGGPAVGSPGPRKTLGNITKFKAAGNPDPCYMWRIGGRSYVYCW